MGIAKVSIQTLRTFVKNGWTIANRRAITSQIGKSNFDEITGLAKKSGISGDVFEYKSAMDYLVPSKIANTKSTLNECANIYQENINKPIQEISRNEVKVYSCIDDILKETHNAPKVGAYGSTEIWRYYEQMGHILRDIQVNGQITNTEFLELNKESLKRILTKYPESNDVSEAILKSVIENIKRMMSKLPKTKEEYILWRGISLNENKGTQWSKLYAKIMNSAKVGDIITPDYATACTSGFSNCAISYAKANYENGRPTLLKIIVKSGNQLSAKGGIGASVKEINLPPMSRYKVIDKQNVYDGSSTGLDLYTLEYIPPEYII